MSSLSSFCSLTGKSSYDIQKKSSLDKLSALRKSSIDLSSKNVKNFITGMVTPNFKRKHQHSTSSDTLTSGSIESINRINNEKVNHGCNNIKQVNLLIEIHCIMEECREFSLIVAG